MHPNQMWQKEMTLMMDNEDTSPRITRTDWTSFGRVDLVETDNPLFKTLFIDGGAGTKMIEMRDGKVRPAVAESLLFSYMGGVPLLIVEQEDREKAAVIGSGGGIDVVTLLLADYKKIDAVEINPDFIRLVQDESEYNGGLYNGHPRVFVHNDEGRSFLRDQNEDYNLILMGLPIIKSARNFTNHSLTENYLFTQDAFAEYLEALEPGGFLIVIAHYPNELKRLFSNAIKSVSEKYNISESIATQHVASIGDDRNPTLILKSGVFSPAEVNGLRAILTNLPVSGSVNFIPFSGESTGDVQFDRGMVALARDEIDLAQFIDAHNEDISWVTDDSPFFYQMTKRLPSELRTVLLTVLVLTVGAVAGFILRRRDETLNIPRWNSLMMFLSFGCIGIGFMMVEIEMIQMFTVFWHHQTKALSVVLASILAAAGTGSLLSSRIKNTKTFVAVMGLLLILQVLYAFYAVTYWPAPRCCRRFGKSP
jgi:spermidine synthase